MGRNRGGAGLRGERKMKNGKGGEKTKYIYAAAERRGERKVGVHRVVRGCVVFSQSEKETSPTVGGGVGRRGRA